MTDLKTFIAKITRKFGVTPDEPQQVQPELFHNYLISLQSHWLLLGKGKDEAEADPVLAKIQDLLAQCEKPKDNWDASWHRAWQAEQLMARYLDGTDIVVECERRLFEAEKLKLASQAHFAEKWKGAAAIEDSAARVKMQRSVYGNLLDDIQWLYGKRKLDRKVRSQMARNIRQIAFMLLVAAVLPFIPWTNGDNLGSKLIGSAPNGLHFYGLYTAATFGLLGALFSRLIFMQTNYSTLDYDDLMNVFQNRALSIRLLVGMVGALIVFYGILGHVLSGDLFPDLSTLKLSPPADIDKDFCKLVIWCFLGGFSQTLVPDFLTRTESSASKTS
jgi:hypothetical protein